MYSNFTMTPSKGSLEKEHHHLGDKRGERGGVLTRKGKKSNSNVVRFTERLEFRDTHGNEENKEREC